MNNSKKKTTINKKELDKVFKTVIPPNIDTLSKQFQDNKSFSLGYMTCREAMKMNMAVFYDSYIK